MTQSKTPNLESPTTIIEEKNEDKIKAMALGKKLA